MPKSCKDCLHIEVCKDYNNVKSALSQSHRNMFSDKAKNKITNGIAEDCRRYLVYDTRSTENLVRRAKGAIRSFEWLIAMCKKNGKADKHLLIRQSDDWFKNDFVDTLERGLEDLKFIDTEDEV